MTLVKKYSVFVMTLLLSSIAFSQQVGLEMEGVTSYDNPDLYYGVKPKFRERGSEENYQDIGFFGSKLKPYYAGNEQALKSFKKYRLNAYATHSTSLIGAASLVYFVGSFTPSTPDQVGFRSDRWISLGITALSTGVYFLTIKKKQYHLYQSVKHHNQSIQKPSSNVLESVLPSKFGFNALPAIDSDRWIPTFKIAWSL